MKLRFFSLFFSLLVLSNAWAAGIIIIDESYWPGRPPPVIIVPPDRPSPRPIPAPRVYQFSPLEITSHRGDVKVTDQIAETKVDEEFYNPNDRQMEGTFLFPIPRGAQLKSFDMEIDGKKVAAELLGADKARGIYEDIVRKLKDPALLEYAGQDIYKVRIFPIEARGKKRISLAWTQLLPNDSGLISLTFPLATEKFSARPIPSVSLKVTVETTRPLKTIYSPSHHVEIRRRDDNHATIGYEASNIIPQADFQLLFGTEKEELGINLMTYRAPGEDGYFLLLAAPGVTVDEKKVMPKDVVFVLDASGSMAGKKLEQAQKALAFCVASLNANDRFEVLRFSTETDVLFSKLVEASKENRAKADEYIKGIKSTGGTAIDDALKKALSLRPGASDRPLVVIFLTDGLPTIGTTDASEIVANVKRNSSGNVRVFCFGIGSDVNVQLLDRITEETRAASQYVLAEEDIEIKISNFFIKIKDPVLTAPALSFTGGIRASKLHPSPLPDLFRGEQLVLVGRYSGQGASAAVVEGKVEGESKRFSYDIQFPESNREHDFIPRLWATRRVGFLLQEIRLRGDNAELRDEATELARKYGIVTPYTAYLIVEDEARRNIPLGAQSMPQLQRDTAARNITGQLYEQGRGGGGGSAPVTRARNEELLKSANAPADAILLGQADASLGLSSFAQSAQPAMPPNAFAPSGAAAGGGGAARGGGRAGGGAGGAGGRGGAGGGGGGFGGGGGIIAGTTPSVAPDVSATVLNYTQQSRFVGGRNFYQNGAQWIDSTIQALKDPARIRIQINSKEYFDLIAAQKDVLPWLSLGTAVQFVLDGKVFEIYE